PLYLSMLRVNHKFIMVALPDEPFPELSAFNFSKNGALLGGSHIGSKKEALAMLDCAVKQGFIPYRSPPAVKEAGKAVHDVRNSAVKYRHVLK
ncbi:hypothetical protein AX16_008177, partial [Volvariella volvacea WC 439]